MGGSQARPTPLSTLGGVGGLELGSTKAPGSVNTLLLPFQNSQRLLPKITRQGTVAAAGSLSPGSPWLGPCGRFHVRTR